MPERSRLWRAAAWLGLVSDRPKPQLPVEFWLLNAVVIVFCVAVIAALRP